MSSYFLRLSYEKQNLCVKGYTGFIFEYLIPNHSLKELLIYCPTNSGSERLFPHKLTQKVFSVLNFCQSLEVKCVSCLICISLSLSKIDSLFIGHMGFF